jgi:heavy metal translocating P-type ATPase
MSGSRFKSAVANLSHHGNLLIAFLALIAIVVHVAMRFVLRSPVAQYEWPLWIALAAGGGPLVLELLLKVAKLQFGSDLLAGISIVTSLFLHEYLAGTIVVLMLSGGEALEAYAVRSASSVLRALSRRMPSVAHLLHGSQMNDVSLEQVAVGDMLMVFPHEICPVDGIVCQGHGVMDESFLTGEPFQMSKTPGSEVISGAVNGQSALTIRATRLAADSRYAKIMQVMRACEKNRPRLRRMGDTLGAFYTPLAVGIALLAWMASGHADRFLAVLVIATPCPLLIAIPVAIIGAISLSARRGIVVKNPAVLEQIDSCRTIIFDKTGTLTYGQPHLVEQNVPPGQDAAQVLALAASIERYSKHPLAQAILNYANDTGIAVQEASQISEAAGEGLRGVVGGRTVQILSRGQILAAGLAGEKDFPLAAEGLECCVAIDGRFAAVYRFRDEPRAEGASFIQHLLPRHHFSRVMIVSGDRESEVRYLAEQLGITEIHAQQTPEQKVNIVRTQVDQARTLYVGDGINDAPALLTATVGIAIGQNSDVTTEAAGVVIMDSSLVKVDEFMHISRRMRTIALQSAVGGMALSALGMVFAAFGCLIPVVGALVQECIDVLAVLNALRAAVPPRHLTDFR